MSSGQNLFELIKQKAREFRQNPQIQWNKRNCSILPLLQLIEPDSTLIHLRISQLSFSQYMRLLFQKFEIEGLKDHQSLQILRAIILMWIIQHFPFNFSSRLHRCPSIQAVPHIVEHSLFNFVFEAIYLEWRSLSH
ncbi:hypothetical protein FGO68_gene7076 [Halteria grandinella]|uniref:Uncharacterized protein n=1 Tax=Halteria grandinella TaxID=5974 RepID=A0A8J8T117_HALGN|nr:hypothetical protein FGO68_gene7076 [Halteria grandinella]